ncbi:MAG: flagellar hook-length control protein FliK [Rhodospirillales bacterium]
MLTDPLASLIEQTNLSPAKSIRRGSNQDERWSSFDLLVKDQERLAAADQTFAQAETSRATERTYDWHQDDQRADDEVTREDRNSELSPSNDGDRADPEITSSRSTPSTRDRSEPVAQAYEDVDPRPNEEGHSAAGGGADDGVPPVPPLQHRGVICVIGVSDRDGTPVGADPISTDPTGASEGLTTAAVFASGQQPIITQASIALGLLLSPAAGTAGEGTAGEGTAGEGTATSAADHAVGSALAPTVQGGNRRVGPASTENGGSKIAPGQEAAAKLSGGDGKSGALAVAAASEGKVPSNEGSSPSQGKGQGTTLSDPSAVTRMTVPDVPSSMATGEKTSPSVRPMVQQIAVHMARGAKDGLSHVRIALEPDSLGRLEIRLDFGRDGSLTAAITADRPETLNMLRNEAQALEDSLNDAGFKASQDNLSFDLSSNSDQGSSFLPQTQFGRASAPYGEGVETSDDPLLKSLNWRPVSAGRLDIRA